jgi:uncharacterized protein YdhG (YjbR/CyaY superfamily)
MRNWCVPLSIFYLFNQNKIKKMRNDSNKPLPKNIDEYLMDVPEKQRLALEELRQIIRETAPKAEEVISYGMPAFKHHGMLVYFAAFKNHCSLFAANSTLIGAMYLELKAYKTSKGTIQFTPEKPLPVALVQKIVLERVRQNEAKAAAKKK